jgi:hypothetical protein
MFWCSIFADQVAARVAAMEREAAQMRAMAPRADGRAAFITVTVSFCSRLNGTR